VLVLAGCASTRPTLVALPTPPITATVVDEQAGSSILLRSVSVPGYLETFPVVLGRANGALVVSDSAEWAERFSDGVTRVLRDALSRRIGAGRVLIARDGRLPDADLTIEFLSLDPAAGAVQLDARWFFACALRRQSRGGRTHVEVPLARATPDAVAEATTAALTRFADELAMQAPCAEQPQQRVPASQEQTP
ncbi:MAG: PqiC family protein, partial [Burkholderiales bacterium]